jgi:hypothetical protein
MNSLSAIERANPPPRRKSCQACIKAKRRCNLGQPACLRCTQRLLECRYSPIVPAARRSVAENAEKQQPVAVHSISIPPSALHSQEVSESTEQTDYNNMILTNLSSMADPALDAGYDFFDTDLDMLQFIQDTPTETVESLDMSSSTTASTAARPPTPSYNNLDLIHQPKGDLALAVQPEGKWRTASLSFTIAHRLQYSIDVVTDAPRKMVMELQTPWCHPELYRDNMPKSMQGMPFLHCHLMPSPSHTLNLLYTYPLMPLPSHSRILIWLSSMCVCFWRSCGQNSHCHASQPSDAQPLSAPPTY